MKRQDIMRLIEELSRSQGFYGRLLAGIQSLRDEDREELFREWEAEQFREPLDFIFYVEA